ncbi:PAS domain S-box protein [bacterium]|nr:PAS domain S-box protein [bacterium]
MRVFNNLVGGINLGGLPSEPADAATVLATIVENIPYPIWIFDKHHDVVYDNKICWKFGSGGSAIGRSVSGFSPAVSAMLDDGLHSSRANEQFEIREGWVDSPVLGHCYLHFDFLPLPHDFVAVAPTDMTEMKRAEQRLERSEEQTRFFAEILERSTVPFAAATPSGILLTFNPAFCELTGYSEQELRGTSWTGQLTPPHWREQEARILAKLRQTHQPQRYEIELMCRNKSMIPVEILAQVMCTATGEPQFFFIFVEDISERHKLQEQILREQKDESITTLAGGIAHDFNNILTGIVGAVSLIHEVTPPDSNLAEWSDIIATSAERMADMTTKLLTYARGGQLKPVSMEFPRALKDAIVMAKSSLPSNVQILLDCPDDLWLVTANPGQLNQVLLNLIINAGEAMQRSGGSLCIRARNEKHQDDWTCVHHRKHVRGNYVHAEFSDSGHGMDEATLARIFEPFYSTKAEGRGLGLAASIGVVTGLGGCLYATSRPGTGSTFHLLLPKAASLPLPTAKPDAAPTGQHETILLIDDDEIVIRVMTNMLREAGYRILSAVNGPDGLSQYRMSWWDIDLVILDVHMPIMSGTDVLREILEVNRDARVLLCSGYSETQAAETIGNLKAAGFIQKPYRADQLAAKVRQALRTNRE